MSTRHPGAAQRPGGDAGIDTDQTIHALLLAGARQGETDVVAREAGVACKAFAPAAGRPMIERVLAVLLNSRRVAGIEVALGSHDELPRQAPALAGWLADGSVTRVDPGPSPARTVARALSEQDDGRSVLVTTADHALLNDLILHQFLDRAAAADVDAAAGLVPMDVLASRFPGTRRTGLRMRDGRFAGCNLFLLRTGPAARSLVSFWQRLETLRKSPWRMARAVGPATLLLYALGRLTLQGAVERLEAETGARVAPVLLDIPEAAIDVDTPADLAFVEKLLGSR